MVLPIILLVVIPFILGMAYLTPFDLSEELPQEAIAEEPNVGILYFVLIGIWIFFLLRVLIQIKKGIFKITHGY